MPCHPRVAPSAYHQCTTATSRMAGHEGSSGFELFLGHDRARILPFCADVAVDEFDDGDRRRVGDTDTRLDDAGVAAVAVGVAWRDHVEQLGELRLVHQP